MSYTDLQPPRAVASNQAPHPALPAAPAEEAGERGQVSFIGTDRVFGIEPVQGWSLYSHDEWDRDGFRTPGYTARRGNEEVLLQVSRFRFTPSQARFGWLVRNGFPDRPPFGPWDDTDIEMRLALEAI